MRICLVYDCLFPYTVGGAERWYRNLGERLGREPLALRDALDFDGDCFKRLLHPLESLRDFAWNARLPRLGVAASDYCSRHRQTDRENYRG